MDYTFPMDLSLYIHFPFCVRKCLYCDFDSVAGSAVTPDEFVTAVLREMELRADRLVGPVSVPTLYFGGGTPSLMSPQLVERVIGCATRIYNLNADAEVTLEANPGTVTPEKLSGYRQAGVNRLSLGVQALDDRLLQRLGRVHSVEQAVAAYEAARMAGFDNMGIDLIHSLPGQTLAMWQGALQAAIMLAPEHFSAYSLSIEEGTPFSTMEERGELSLPNEEDSAAMFEATRELLAAAGYEHYEISNFARPGYRSRHNQVYWRRGNYLGFGAGAHSFLRQPGWGMRWVNPRAIASYLAAMAEGCLQDEERQCLTQEEALSEALFLGLRLADGIEPGDLDREFGGLLQKRYGKALEDLEADGLLAKSNRRLAISPQAVIFANRIFSRFV